MFSHTLDERQDGVVGDHQGAVSLDGDGSAGAADLAQASGAHSGEGTAGEGSQHDKNGRKWLHFRDFWEMDPFTSRRLARLAKERVSGGGGGGKKEESTGGGEGWEVWCQR